MCFSKPHSSAQGLLGHRVIVKVTKYWHHMSVLDPRNMHKHKCHTILGQRLQTRFKVADQQTDRSKNNVSNTPHHLTHGYCKHVIAVLNIKAFAHKLRWKHGQVYHTISKFSSHTTSVWTWRKIEKYNYKRGKHFWLKCETKTIMQNRKCKQLIKIQSIQNINANGSKHKTNGTKVHYSKQ